jgi:hypothetical protein
MADFSFHHRALCTKNSDNVRLITGISRVEGSDPGWGAARGCRVNHRMREVDRAGPPPGGQSPVSVSRTPRPVPDWPPDSGLVAWAVRVGAGAVYISGAAVLDASPQNQ